MTRIPDLPTVTAVSAGDFIPMFTSGSINAKMTVGQFLAFFQDNFASPEFTIQNAAPTLSGFSINIGSPTTNTWLIIDAVAPYAAGEIVFPPVADAFDGQQILVTSRQAVTALSLNSNGASAMVGFPSTLGQGGFFAARFDALHDAWYCTSQSNGSLGVGTFTDITLSGDILDANGNELINFPSLVAAAVNEVAITNAATGSPALIAATGGDASVGLSISSKATGTLALASPTGSATLTANDSVTLTATTVGVALVGPVVTMTATNDISALAGGKYITTQPTPNTLNITGALTHSIIRLRIVTSTTAAAVVATLDTGTVLDAATVLAVDSSFDWDAINTGPNAFTVTAAAGHTIVGDAVVATLTSGKFRSRKTAANTFVTYRLG